MSSDEVSQAILEHIGFHIDKLSEPGDRESADFLGKFSEDIFLIEAKIKTDSHKLKNEKEAALSRGEVFASEASLGPDETILTILKKAAHQLRASAKVHAHDFKIIFVLCDGANAKTKRDKFVDVLYGRTGLIESGVSNPTLKPCYYFRHAELYRKRGDVDAVIIGYDDAYHQLKFTLCFNSFSERYSALKSSALIRKFGSAIIDPIEEERRGSAYIPDDDIPRSEDDDNEKYLTPLRNPMLHHLANKYKINPLISVDFQSSELMIREKQAP